MTNLINDYPKTYEFIESVVSLDLGHINKLNYVDKKELVAIFVSESDSDTFLDILIDPKIQQILSEFLMDGLDYSLSLQEIIYRSALESGKYIFDELFEMAKDNWEPYCEEDAYENNFNESSDLQQFMNKYQRSSHV